MGKIAHMLQESERIETPLQKRLKKLGKWLGILVLGVCAIIFALERSEEHTSELQSHSDLVCRLLLEKKKNKKKNKKKTQHGTKRMNSKNLWIK